MSLRTCRDVDIRRQSKVVKRVAFWQSPKWPLLAQSRFWNVRFRAAVGM